MKSEIPGVVFFPLSQNADSRGWLAELYRSDWLYEENAPEMAYVSMTLPGVVRGPHEHYEQSDYFAFVGPGDFDLHLWERQETDNDNPYILHEVHRVGSSNRVAVIIPPGVVHAYKNVSDVEGWVFNAPNALYAGPGKKYPVDEIRHEDGVTSHFYKVQ